MKKYDLEFIKQVAKYYHSTVDADHPNGNISKVMEKFSISRTKALKLLITSGAIDTELHHDIMKLLDEGYTLEQIAEKLNVSVTTVKTHMPYQKVIYNSEQKSIGAEAVERFRAREKTFMNMVIRNSDLQETGDHFLEKSSTEVMMKQLLPDLNFRMFEDIAHLKPVFTEKEGKKFKIHPDIALLHIELDEEVKKEYRRLCGIRYGKSFSRDILVPYILPLHNLHYAINQAFGFNNSHEHEYALLYKDLQWVTENSVDQWKKLIGLVFRNPFRDKSLDHWDDDYKGGSPKKWMRSKYTGPSYRFLHQESYRYIVEALRQYTIQASEMNELMDEVDNPFEVNETLPVYNIFQVENGMDLMIEEFNEDLQESMEEAKKYADNDPASQPDVTGFVKQLLYTYDTDWKFTITVKADAEYLLHTARVNERELKEAIAKVCTYVRPVMISGDGDQLMDDCGGVEGYIRMIREMEKGNEEVLSRIRELGWKRKRNKNNL